ncbi:Rho termination factor N-terminal domain-containing protein [Krasilnikovia sp. M28-CT-15]|uniref:Rho termination factor N-terminal domain-containing protein n=1 Tax=Krasilnikovia sp. M28-CT-15 TaxID=3373540 RepID=UPI003876DD21
MSGNEDPDTSGTNETELRGMKVAELRERANAEGADHTSSMRKDELVSAVSRAHRHDGGDPGTGSATEEPVGAGPDDGRVRTGDQTSKSLKYSQEITAPDQEPERAGRSLVTTSHEVIRQWAEQRGAVPATVEGTGHDDRLGVLRFDFGRHSDRLRQVTWEEWFGTFDARRLNFIYQQERSDGRVSNFFRLESPDREDA